MPGGGSGERNAGEEMSGGTTMAARTRKVQLEFCDPKAVNGRTWATCQGFPFEQAETMGEGEQLAAQLTRDHPQFRFRVSPVQPGGFQPVALVQLSAEEVQLIRMGLEHLVRDFSGLSEGMAALQYRAKELLERSEGW